MKSRVLSVLFPEKCVLCRKILGKEEMDLCHQCRIHGSDCPISRKKFSFVDSWAAVWYYEKEARNSLLRFKFGGKRHYAQCYGRLLAMKLLQAHPEGFDILCYVPTGKWKRWKRGYDQVLLLAEAVGEQLELKPVQLLKKVRATKTQSRIQGEARRRANVLGAYAVTDAEAAAGKNILMLDDIITTGATAEECARVLKTAGAKQVFLGAVAVARRQGKSSR